MADIIIALIVLAVVGAAVMYIVKEKKKGTRCIGCPSAGACAGNKACSCCDCQIKEV